MEKSNTQYVKNEATDSLGRSRGGAILQNCAFHYQSGCIDSLEVRKKPGGYWIIRDLAGLDLVGLASL
ncbi:hypothetical protein FAD47_22500 [Escherichia coli]|nr:hypothetical protein [Escherichia coli]